MGDRLRLAFGIIGNAVALMLFSAPILTFSTVIKKKSIGEFSCIPYVITFFNCLNYMWYGLPVVSHLWENFSLITINGLGIILELFFIIIYFWFAPRNGKICVAAIFVPIIFIFSATVAISTFVIHDHHHRKVFVGSFGMVSSVGMYASPLVAVKKVIETKSVEFMPFSLSFFTLVNSCVWMLYGLLSHDFVLASPNLVGIPLGILQLIVYFKYKKAPAAVVSNWDAEKNINEEDNNNKVATTFELDIDDDKTVRGI